MAEYLIMKITKPTFAKYLNNDELMFKLSIGMKFTLLSGLFALIVTCFTYIILKIDLLFFEVHGYVMDSVYQDTFYEFVFSNIVDLLPWIFVFFIILFISGFYIGTIMMRPFKLIGKHCDERLNDQNRFYEPDYLSDLKLLTSFSSFFFARVDEAKVKGKLEIVNIPTDFTNIHKPILEKNFFINYAFLIVIFALLASLGIFFLNNEVKDKVMIFATKVARNNIQVKSFIERQEDVESKAIMGLLITHMTINILFGIHLYNKIASPAFAVFATLRSFLKGNYHNRIHLIGFYYLRNDCRKINKYLDHVQKTLT